MFLILKAFMNEIIRNSQHITNNSF